MNVFEEPQAHHQVGITNAQKDNPNAELSRLTEEMNTAFEVRDYSRAARLALSITSVSKEDLRTDFESQGVKILRLDHEAFGIYQGKFEPAYDLLVKGETSKIIVAAKKFGLKHAQQAILVARVLEEKTHEEGEQLGTTITLGTVIKPAEAVRVSDFLRKFGFMGATFSPLRQGTIVIYHSPDLGMNRVEFEAISKELAEKLTDDYPDSKYEIGFYMLSLIHL